MRKFFFVACILSMITALFPAWAPAMPVPSDAVAVDKALAQQCLVLARAKDEAERYHALMLRLHDLEAQNFSPLAALVREALGSEVAEATAVPPRTHLYSAWLLNVLDAKAETLAFDRAVDGKLVRWIQPGKQFRFQTFGKEDIIVHINASAFGYKDFKSYPGTYVRMFLRQIPGSSEYYAAVVQALRKQRRSAPLPNPEGRHIPSLMDQCAEPAEATRQ